MAYDHSETRHSTLEQGQADVEAFLKRQVPPQKICLGLPFYGRSTKSSEITRSYAEP
jgi:GH18 family chitinase